MEAINKTKWQHIEWEKIIAKNISGKGLIPNIQKTNSQKSISNSKQFD